MYKAGLFALLALALQALPAAAQVDGQSYCKLGDAAPNRNDCMKIVNAIKDGESYRRDEWWAGSCKVWLHHRRGQENYVMGRDLKRGIEDVLNTCDVGWKYINNVGILVEQCTIEGWGLPEPSVCSGPLQHVQKTTPLPGRRHLTHVPRTAPEMPSTPANVFERANPPPADTICGGGPGSSHIADCKGLVDKFGKEPITLPYKAVNGDCELQVWPMNKETKTAVSKRVNLAVHGGSNVCADKTKTIVGLVENHRMDRGYHVFFGPFCGTFFNTGFSGNCLPGGK